MPRPERLVVVTGTGTDVGKTWVTVEIARALRAAGVSVAVRKPAQSFAPGDADTDASLLAEATGVSPETVCPSHRWYPVPLAPPMAADALARSPIAIDDLVAEIVWPDDTQLGFVEGAGGLCSPIAHDGDTLTLVERLRPDLVLLVADPALGVVSSVRLTAHALDGVPPLVVLNRFDETDDVHCRSRDWLRDTDGFSVITHRDLAANVDLFAALTPLTA
ncbi:MAG: ATP-dependent dethiobiotin synthetase BioD [Microthrixaceae bacterium]